MLPLTAPGEEPACALHSDLWFWAPGSVTLKSASATTGLLSWLPAWLPWCFLQMPSWDLGLLCLE